MTSSRTPSIWPTRVTWPRPRQSLLPALVTDTSAARPFSGKSRFTISPLHLTLDQLLFLVTAALLSFGLVMVQSADARVREGASDNWFLQSLLNKNALHAGLGILAMIVAWRIDYRRILGKRLWLSPPVILTLCAFILLAIALTPYGRATHGARRWLTVPVLRVSLQPSELAKWSLILFIAAYAAHRQADLRKYFKGFLPLIFLFGAVVAPVLIEDFGTAALICLVCFILLLMSGAKWWHVALLVPPALAVAYIAVWHTPYRRERLLSFLHPDADPRGSGYHAIQSLLTITSGGFWGRGLGNGIQKMGYLPEDDTDFIFSVICEELGFFGALVIIALFITFVIAGWRIVARTDNLFGKMVAFGITATFGLQAAINIAVVTVTLPTKGIALPLVSSGGTGWIMTALAIGILMSIERVNRHEALDAARADGPAPPALGFPVIMGPASPMAAAAANDAPAPSIHSTPARSPASATAALALAVKGAA